MGWPWSKKPKSPVAEIQTEASRYAGKPLLRLLELYVIWAIGELPDEEARRLETMSPKLAETFGGDGTWQGALAATMEMPPNMPDLIREMWAKNQGIASLNHVELRPQQFAEMFVASNLT